METLFYLGIAVLFGIWTSSIAKKHNWSQVVAFIVGCLFGILAVIGYAIGGKFDNDNKRDLKIKELEERTKREEDKSNIKN